MDVLLPESFPDCAGRFDGLGWRDFFGDRFLLLDAKPFIQPAAHVFDKVGQALHW